MLLCYYIELWHWVTLLGNNIGLPRWAKAFGYLTRLWNCLTDWKVICSNPKLPLLGLSAKPSTCNCSVACCKSIGYILRSRSCSKLVVFERLNQKRLRTFSSDLLRLGNASPITQAESSKQGYLIIESELEGPRGRLWVEQDFCIVLRIVVSL